MRMSGIVDNDFKFKLCGVVKLERWTWMISSCRSHGRMHRSWLWQTNKQSFFVCTSLQVVDSLHRLVSPPSTFYPLSRVACMWYSNNLGKKSLVFDTANLNIACIWYGKLYTVPPLLVFNTVTPLFWGSSACLQRCQFVLPLSSAFFPCLDPSLSTIYLLPSLTCVVLFVIYIMSDSPLTTPLF